MFLSALVSTHLLGCQLLDTSEIARGPKSCQEAELDCGPFGSCSERDDGALECACQEGYTGALCALCAAGYQDEDGDGSCQPSCELAQQDCGHGGICYVSRGAAACDCHEGYTGTFCNTCAPGFQDSNGDGICRPDCETSGLYCGEGGTCQSRQGTPVCVCDLGYGGENCMACQPGYQRHASGICNPTCELGLLDCGAYGACQDEGGASECACLPGYSGELCRDCDAGYQDRDNNGSCLPSCESQPIEICGDHGRCDDEAGHVVCACEPGYEGDSCERCARDFQDNDGDGVCEQGCALGASMCSSRSTCDDSSGRARCVCDEGYGGARCDACAPGYQDHDGDHVCQRSCDGFSSTCTMDEICVDLGKPAVCTSYPASCAQAYALGAEDGIVDLFVDNDPAKPWEAFCVEMNSPSPKAYLPLRKTSGSSNRFQLVDQDGLVAQSEYWMVRVDPITMEVLILDTAGARTSYYREMTTTSVPYGVAMACTGGGSNAVKATGRIDLTHTPFQITAPFAGYGECPSSLAVDGGQARSIEVWSASAMEGSCAGVGPLAFRERFGEACDGATSVNADEAKDTSRALQLVYQTPAPSLRDYPKTCLELELAKPNVSDGIHTLYLDGDPGRPWSAVCEGMQGSPSDYISQLKNPNVRQDGPRAYISLTAQDVDSNLIEDGGNNTHPVSRETRYTKVRFDPRLFEVDVLDTTYSTWVLHDPGAVPDAQAYGHVSACSGVVCTGNHPGRAKLDLRGTPFRFEDTFLERVSCNSALVTSSAAFQVIELESNDVAGEVAPERAGCRGRQHPYYSDDRFYLRLGPL